MSIRSRAARLRGRLNGYARKAWFEPLRAAGILALGRSGQGVLKLAAVAVAAQALGTSGFGTLVLINAARKLLGGLVFVRATHLIMRAGAQALETDDRSGFGRTVAFGFWLDAVSAALATTAVMAATGSVGAWLNLPPDAVTAARLFGLCVVFQALTITAEAVLQLFGRFRILAIQGMVLPGLQLAGGGLAFALDGGLPAFLVVWFVAIALARGCLLAACLVDLHRRGLLAHVRAHARRVRTPEAGAWRYLLAVNAQASMRQVQERGSVIAAGALFDPGAAALVQVARQVGGVLTRPVKTVLTPAILPVLMRQTAANWRKTRRKTVRNFSAGSLAVALAMVGLLVVSGQTILATAFGPDFAGAYPVMLLFALGGVVRVATVTFEPLLASSGRVRPLVAAQAVALAVNLGLLATLIPWIGLEGAALAEALALVLQGLVQWIGARAQLRQHDDAPQPTRPSTS